MSSETVAEQKLSPVEGHKVEGRFLRGTLAEEMADPAVEHLSDMNKSLIKFHGSYQQEDRDARKNRSKAGVGKAYMFMVRLKLPGGKLTADQYLAMDDLCGKYANGTLRVTTRQSFQFHGVLEAEPEVPDGRHQRGARHHARRLRRRQPQRHLVPGTASRCDAPAQPGTLRRGRGGAHAPGGEGLVPRDLAQRRETGGPGSR